MVVTRLLRSTTFEFPFQDALFGPGGVGRTLHHSADQDGFPANESIEPLKARSGYAASGIPGPIHCMVVSNAPTRVVFFGA